MNNILISKTKIHQNPKIKNFTTTSTTFQNKTKQYYSTSFKTIKTSSLFNITPKKVVNSSVLLNNSSIIFKQQKRTYVYGDKVIEHYNNPRNVGSLNKGDQDVGTGIVGAPACGDVMKLQIRVGKDGKITETVFKTFGCGSAIASSSLATEMIKGKTLNECLDIKNSDIASYLSLPPVKLHCSMLAEDAIKAAIKDYQDKNPGAKVTIDKLTEEEKELFYADPQQLKQKLENTTSQSTTTDSK